MKKTCMAYIYLVPMVLGICVVAQGAPMDNRDGIAALRTALEKWVETKQLISREKQKWQDQKEMLINRKRLMEDQAKDLEDKIEEARVSLKKAEQKRDDLSSEHENLESALLLLRERTAPLEQKVLRLLHHLPEPLKEKVEPLSQEIPAETEQTELSLSTRYQNLMGVLNFINKFNNAITLTTEVRTFEENQAVEVKVMYLGLGQAYFCNDAATVAGVGRPTVDGWKWNRHDKIAPAVSSAMAMYHNEIPADYVALPVETVKLREE